MVKKLICDSSGNYLRTEEVAKPACGEAYCERCGDCVACSSECYYGGMYYDSHLWIVYEGREIKVEPCKITLSKAEYNPYRGYRSSRKGKKSQPEFVYVRGAR